MGTIIFIVSAAKITVHNVKCTETYLNFFSATVNYPSAVFSLQELSDRKGRKQELDNKTVRDHDGTPQRGKFEN